MNSPRKRKIGTIIGVVIGCVSAVFSVIAITTFVRRRRRRDRPRSIVTLSTDFREAGPELTVTPFDLYGYEAFQDSRMLAEQQPLVTEGPEAEMLAFHRQSSTPLVAIPLPQPGAPVPVGLSDKEIARLRAEGNNSHQSRNLGASSRNVPEADLVALHRLSSTPLAAIPLPQPGTRVPIGLTDKEIARLRAEGIDTHQSRNLGASSSNVPEADVIALHRQSTTPLAAIPLPQPGTRVPVGLSDKEIARLRAEGNSQPSPNLGVSSSNVLQSTSALNPVPEFREAPYDPRRLHSEVESLVRREMERLHAEGLVIGAPPPSYTTGDGPG